MKTLILLSPAGRHRDLGGGLGLPVGACRILSYVKAHLPEARTLAVDLQVSFGFPLTAEAEARVRREALEALAPEVNDRTLFGITCHSNRDILHALPLARDLRERFGRPVILGGYGPSACSRMVLDSWPGLFDGVCVGPGEQTALALLRGMEHGLGPLHQVPNLAFSDGGRAIAPQLFEPPVAGEPLDLSPLWDRELYPLLPLYASQGCPFRCRFCLDHQVSPGYRPLTPEAILKDMDSALAALEGVCHVAFVDPVFGLGPRRTAKLIEGLAQRGLTCSFYARADALAEGLFPLLKDRCTFIFLGLEAVASSALERMGKGKRPDLYLQRLTRTVRRCVATGITPQLGLMPNYPLSTWEEGEEALAYVGELADLARGSEGGLGTTVFAYHIWPNTHHHRILPDLLAAGMTVRPGFPAQYHGLAVPAEFRLDVHDASPGLTWGQFEALRARAYGLAVPTARSLAGQALNNLVFVSNGQVRVLDGGPVLTRGEGVVDVGRMMAGAKGLLHS